MYRVSFHINRAERACRTKVLAGSAADAPFGIHNGDSDRVHIFTVGRDHQYRTRRAMTGTVAALHSIGQRNAILPDPYGMADTGG